MKVYLITDHRDRAFGLYYTLEIAEKAVKDFHKTITNVKFNINSWEILGAPSSTGSESSRSQFSRNGKEE